MPHPASHKHSASNLESQLRAHGAKLFVTDLSLALQAEKKVRAIVCCELPAQAVTLPCCLSPSQVK